MPTRIRAASPADLKPLAAMVDALNALEDLPTGKLNTRALRAGLFGKSAFLFADVAEADEDGDQSLVGYTLSHDAFISDRCERSVYLVDIFVEEAWRREGVGSRLIAAVCRRAKRRGASNIWFASSPPNARARRFYASLGASDAKFHAHAIEGAAFARLVKS